METDIRIQFQFSSKPWKHAGAGGWHFVSLPVKLSREIRSLFRTEEGGWGRLPATARINDSKWKTAIWFDSKLNTYLLPLKEEIRKAEQVAAGKTITVSIYI